MTEDPFKKMFGPMSGEEMDEAKEGLETEAHKTLVMGRVNERLNAEREREALWR